MFPGNSPVNLYRVCCAIDLSCHIGCPTFSRHCYWWFLPRGEKRKKEAALAWIQLAALLWGWRRWGGPRDDPARKTKVAVLLLSQLVFGSPDCKVRNPPQRLIKWSASVCLSINKLFSFTAAILDHCLVTRAFWVLLVCLWSPTTPPTLTSDFLKHFLH